MARLLTLTLNPALDLAIRTGPLRLGEVNRSESTRLDAAGKGINVARVLSSLGHQVTVSGLLGMGNEEAFVRTFHQAGLKDAFVRVPGETRINAKLSEPEGRITDLNGPGPWIPAPALERLNQQVDSLLPGLDAVVIAGSLPPNVTPDALGALVTRIRARGLAVWLDSSGAALRAGVAAGPTGIKPNETELAECVGAGSLTPQGRLAAARQLQSRGIEEVLVSEGADGVVWVGGNQSLRATPPKVTVRSTVGAGDTLLAGALHALLAGWPRERALRFATALAAESVRHVGVGDPGAADFEQLLEQTGVQRLDQEQP